MRKNISIYVEDDELLRYMLHVLKKSKLKFKIIHYDDKSEFPHVIINTSINKRDINKIIKKKFRNNRYILR